MPVPFGGYADDDEPKKKTFGEKLGETWIAKAAKDVLNAAMLPGDVYQGKVDPLSDEAIGRSADLAATVSGFKWGGAKSLGVGARKVPISEAPRLAEEGITTPRGRPSAPVTEAGQAHVAEFTEQAAQQSRSAAEEIGARFDPTGGTVARSPEQAAGMMSEGIRKAAEYERQSIGGQFQFAGQKPGAINAPAFMVLPQNITNDLTNARIVLSNGTKQATAMMKDITREVARLSTTNRGGPAAGKVTNVNLSAIDKMKQRLNTYRQAAFESRSDRDIKATQAVMEAFDNHIDQMINSKAFAGDTSKVKAWNIARDRETLYRKAFETDGRRSVGEVVHKIIGDDKHDPATPRQVADFFWGTIGTNPNKFNAAVAQRIKSILGADSVEWAGAKQGLWQKVVDMGKPDDWQPRMIKDRILQFLDGDGKQMASFMYSAQERAIMRDFANIQGTLDLGIRSTGISAQTAAKATGAMAGQVAQGFGAYAEAVHKGLTAGLARIAEKKELRDLQDKLPVIRKATEKWWNDVQRAQRSNAGFPQRQRADVFRATTTYAQELRKAGIGGVTSPQMASQDRGQDKLTADRAFGGPAM